MLSSDPAKRRQWQERSRERAQERARDRQGHKSPREPNEAPRRARRTPTRNNGPWRDQVMAEYGEMCRACGTTREVQADHMKPRAQGGKNDVANGLPLCREHHEMKTDSKIKIEYEWLEDSHLRYLAEIGWVRWDDEGEPYGNGYRHFGRRPQWAL